MIQPERLDQEETAPGVEPAAAKNKQIGRVASIDGSNAVIAARIGSDKDAGEDRIQIGAILSIDVGETVALGLISAMSAPPAALNLGNDNHGPVDCFVEVELMGEFAKPTPRSPGRFRRGVSSYPSIGDGAFLASRDELAALYLSNSGASVRVGVIKQDASIPATVNVNNLFSRHCAILGTTGAGKSCATALILNSVLRKYPFAHVVVLDVHNEYANCFGSKAMVFNPSTLNLPFWMLTFEELTEILYPNGNEGEEEKGILLELIPTARKMNLGACANASNLMADRRGDNNVVTVNTPTPYRVSDLLTLIDKALGGLETSRATAPFKRLRGRLKQISTDARYSFMFGSLTVQDSMAKLLGQLFRIPVQESPVSVIELGGLPEEVSQVVVSVISRMAYEFGLWSNGATPIALFIEDAHRFASDDDAIGFAPTKRSLIKIAKEGRKTGVSLFVASQRPTELDPTVLSQCNTIFAMRLANQADQEALRAAVPDAATSLLSALPSLGLGEAVAVGESVALPSRIRFDALPREEIPRSLTSSFTDAWAIANEDHSFLERVVDQWRTQRILETD